LTSPAGVRKFNSPDLPRCATRRQAWRPGRAAGAAQGIDKGATGDGAGNAVGACLAHTRRNFSATFGVVRSELQKMTIAVKRKAQ